MTPLEFTPVRRHSSGGFRFSLGFAFLVVTLAGFLLMPFSWISQHYEPITRSAGVELYQSPEESSAAIDGGFAQLDLTRIEAFPQWWSKRATSGRARRECFQGHFNDGHPYYVEVLYAKARDEPDACRIVVRFGYQSRMMIWERSQFLEYLGESNRLSDNINEWLTKQCVATYQAQQATVIQPFSAEPLPTAAATAD